MNQLQRSPSLFNEFLYAVAYYIDDPQTFMWFRMVCKRAFTSTNDPIFIAYKKQQFTKYYKWKGDIMPVLPNGLVHGVVRRDNHLDKHQQYRCYTMGRCTHNISFWLYRTKTSQTQTYFTKNLIIRKWESCNGSKTCTIGNIVNHREIEAYQCSICKQYHTYHSTYNGYLYVIYRDCISKPQQPQQPQQRKWQYLKYDPTTIHDLFEVSPNEKRQKIMMAVIQYSKNTQKQ